MFSPQCLTGKAPILPRPPPPPIAPLLLPDPHALSETSHSCAPTATTDLSLSRASLASASSATSPISTSVEWIPIPIHFGRHPFLPIRLNRYRPAIRTAVLPPGRTRRNPCRCRFRIIGHV